MVKRIACYLNLCESLKLLRWYRHNNAYNFDDNIIDVLQKVGRLEISLIQLLTINFKLKNLKELNIHRGNPRVQNSIHHNIDKFIHLIKKQN